MALCLALMFAIKYYFETRYVEYLWIFSGFVGFLIGLLVAVPMLFILEALLDSLEENERNDPD